MAVAALDPRSLSGENAPWAGPFLQHFGQVCAAPAVARMGVGNDGSALDLWVLMGHESDADETAIYTALARYRAESRDLPIDLHVIVPGETASTWPAAVTTVFVRE